MLVTVAVTRAWSSSITYKTGVKLAATVPGSKAVTLAGWVVLVWLVSAAVAALFGAPLIPVIAAGVSATVSALLGIKIDGELVRSVRDVGIA